MKCLYGDVILAVVLMQIVAAKAGVKVLYLCYGDWGTKIPRSL